MSTTVDETTRQLPGRQSAQLKRASRWRVLMFAAAGLFALAGWGTAAYLYFVAVPDVATAQKVAHTLDLVDRFGDSPAHGVYMQLSDDMKPWWDQIEEMQRRIAATTDDDAREKLIAGRDETLIAFIHANYLSNRIDMLIGSFAPFKRCLDADACDEDTLRKSISIDVKRIYRTFRPYIEAVRTSGASGKDAFGRDLEDLFMRFVG